MLDARPTGELPPPSNTGVTVAWAGVHWFAGTCRRPSSEVCEVVSSLVSAPIVEHERGSKGGYTCSATIGGVLVAWSDPTVRDDVYVSVQGEACELLGSDGLVQLSALLDLAPTSRLDLAWDTSLFTPALVRDAWASGEVVTRVHRAPKEGDKPGRVRGCQWHSNAQGDTLDLGSRTSMRFVRVYDRRGPTRLELELKEERAVLLWQLLMQVDPVDWSRWALEELRAFVDFRELRLGADGSPVRPDCRPLLSWWSEFVGEADRCGVLIPRKTRTLDDTQEWLRKKVAPSFALVADLLGPEAFIRDVLTVGRASYRADPFKVALLDAEAMRRELNAAD